MAFLNVFLYLTRVKSGQYFHTDTILLEMSVHWLSDDIVSFKMEVGFTRNLQKM